MDNLTTVSIPEYHLNKWMLTVVQVPRYVANRLQIINSLTLSLLIWDVNTGIKDFNRNDDGPSELLKSVSNHNTRVLNEYYNN